MRCTKMMPWLVLLLLLFSCRSATTPSAPPVAAETSAAVTADAPVQFWTYEVINTWPHDASAYTQGLIYQDGALYESTGLNGQSTLRRVELETGRVLRKVRVPEEYFAEGMTILGGRVFQLTWKHEKGFIYAPDTLERIGEFPYQGEGWGLTHDGKSLIMSDGTSRIRFINPETFAVERTIDVVYNGRRVLDINELEYIRGEIYANIWQEDQIIRIDPRNGRILGVIDMTGILPGKRVDEADDVLNGIAYDEKGGRIFVTGKRWPRLFEIRFRERK